MARGKQNPADPSKGRPDDAAVETDAKDAKAAEAEEKAAEGAAAPDADPPAAEAEAKPKPARRRRRKKADEAPAAEEQDAADADAAADADESGDASDDDDAEEKPKRRRRASEVTAGRKREPARPAPRTADGAIAVRARAKYVRTAPRKARLVIDHIRGKPVGQARAILLNTPRAASRDVLKLLDSAIANAENNHELIADELVVGQAVVDEGPTLKRYRPRALGRATRIRKRTSHMTITLTTNENGR